MLALVAGRVVRKLHFSNVAAPSLTHPDLLSTSCGLIWSPSDTNAEEPDKPVSVSTRHELDAVVSEGYSAALMWPIIRG